jgi:hypothetical protein
MVTKRKKSYHEECYDNGEKYYSSEHYGSIAQKANITAISKPIPTPIKIRDSSYISITP